MRRTSEAHRCPDGPGCPVGRCCSWQTVWGTPAVMPPSSERRPLTYLGHEAGWSSRFAESTPSAPMAQTDRMPALEQGTEALKTGSKSIKARVRKTSAPKSWKSAKTGRGIASFVTRHQTSCLRLCSNPFHCAVPRPGLEFEEPLGVLVRHLRFVIRADRQIFEEALAGSVVAIRVVDGE
jgi:hypothetical protein